MRDASTKPSAATVLPAPVACSNQKRRRRPGSSSTASAAASSSASSAGVPVERLLVGELVALELHLARGQLLGRGARAVAASRSARHEHLGGERDQRAGERVDLVGGQHGAVHEVRLVLDEQSLEPERSASTRGATHRRLVAAGVELGQRRVERGRRAVPSASAVGRPRRRARTARARIPRRAGDPRRKPARLHHRASFSHDWAFLFRGTDGPGIRRGENRSRAGQQGPPFVFTLSVVPSGERAESIRNCRRTAHYGTRGPIVRSTWVTSATLAACAGSRILVLRRASCWRAAARASRTSRPPPTDFAKLAGAPAPLAGLYTQPSELLDGGQDAFDAAHREAARAPGGGEQVGLVVRALPLRVPVLPEAGGQARQGGRLPRRQPQRQRRRRAEVPRRVPAAVPELQGPRREGRARAPAWSACPPPRSTTARASWPTCTRAGTPARQKLVEDIERYAR